ncbi:MAG: hypothetical protein ABWX67_10030 [Allosphingosinicella sp.]
MTVNFSPIDALSQLLRLNKGAATILVAGLGVFAVVAIATTWVAVGDLQTVGLMAIYIVGFGVVLIILANILQNPVFSFILGGFVTFFIVAIALAFFVSAVFRTQGIINPTYCLVEFWKPCALSEAATLARNPSAADAAAIQPAEVRAASNAVVGVKPQNYRVYVQFAGLIVREDIVNLSRALLSAGWRIESPRGERTSAAHGLNEIRYGRPEDEQAALALAKAVSAAEVGSRPLDIQLTPAVGDGPLEVWVSR